MGGIHGRGRDALYDRPIPQMTEKLTSLAEGMLVKRRLSPEHQHKAVCGAGLWIPSFVGARMTLTQTPSLLLIATVY